jgi:hypothetical protein
MYNVTTPVPVPYASLPIPPHYNPRANHPSTNGAPNGNTNGNANGNANGGMNGGVNGNTSPAYPPPPPHNTQASTQTSTPVPLSILPPKPKANGTHTAHDAHYRLPDGWNAPIHRSWTRGDFVLVTQHNNTRQGYRVHAAVLASAR